jgi:cardiolipin synthase (CMP-forming)
MGLYRARDLLLAPSLLSLMRLPLAVAFVVWVRHPPAAFAVLAVAAATDVLDGYLARHYGMATPTGAAIDPITDKLFVLTVVVALVANGLLRVSDVVLLSMRELGELPLVVWFAFSRRARKSRAEYPKANHVGKAATTLQFGTVSAALFRAPRLDWLLAITAVGGVLAALSYWMRALRPPSRS